MSKKLTIRLPQNWNMTYQDSNSFRMESNNPKFKNWVLFWEFDKEGYFWHVEKVEGRFKSGQYNYYRNFSDAIKEIKF